MRAFDSLILTFSSAGGLGYAPKAPGTFGTLMGIPLWWALSTLNLPVWQFVLVVALLTGFAIWVSGHAERIYASHDSGKIVIDEVVGFLATVIAVDFGLREVIVAFAMFRLFDIIKPPPIGAVDKQVEGGFGVVIDDTIAGLMACPLVHGVLYLMDKFL